MTPVAFTQATTKEQVIPLIYEAIEEQSGNDLRETEIPLHNVVNTDALCDLFSPTADGEPRPGGQVMFHYQGHKVVIDYDIQDGNTWIRAVNDKN